MKTLAEYPSLRLMAPGLAAETGGGSFPDALPVPMGATEALAEAARNIGSQTVVVIDPFVAPSPDLEAFLLEPVLGDAGLCLLFPALSIVTGLALRRGLRVIPAARLDDPRALNTPALTLPHLAGRFAANDSPQRAFRTAYELMSERPVLPADRSRLRHALAASLGADALNGPWWILGALTALLGRDPAEAAWAECAPLLATPSDLPGRIRAVSRQVRLETGLPVQALDAGQSRAIKRLLPATAPDTVWHDFVAGCADLGTDGKALAARYAKARALIWAEGAVAWCQTDSNRSSSGQ